MSPEMITCLRLAVSLRVAEIAELGGGEARMEHPTRRRRADIVALLAHTDTLLYGAENGRAAVFDALAGSIAVLAHAPGGVPAFGLQWCARHVPAGVPLTDVQLCRSCLIEETFDLSLATTGDPAGLAAVLELAGDSVPKTAADVGTLWESLPTPGRYERKKRGSYYTPAGLVDLVLEEALDPLLDEAERTPDPAAALLALTICDPACGGGAFPVAAARRLATRLAKYTGDPRQALREVIERCIYAVDLDQDAVEVCKVVLRLEAWHPGHPVVFLDPHIKVGNSLLGTTPALLAGGVPDAAFAVLGDDDPKYAAMLRQRNKAERERDTAAAALFEVAS